MLHPDGRFNFYRREPPARTPATSAQILRSRPSGSARARAEAHKLLFSFVIVGPESKVFLGAERAETTARWLRVLEKQCDRGAGAGASVASPLLAATAPPPAASELLEPGAAADLASRPALARACLPASPTTSTRRPTDGGSARCRAAAHRRSVSGVRATPPRWRRRPPPRSPPPPPPPPPSPPLSPACGAALLACLLVVVAVAAARLRVQPRARACARRCCHAAAEGGEALLADALRMERSSYDRRVVGGRVVAALSVHLDVVHVELPARRDGMMVCAPRDACLLRWWGRSVDGSSSYVVCSSVVHSACPPRRGVVRVTEWESSMRIEKSGVGSVVLQTLEWSPAGWLGAVGAWAGLVSDDLLAALPRAQQRRGMVEETAAKGSVVAALPPSDVEPYAERAVLEALRRRRPSDAINAIGGAGPLPEGGSVGGGRRRAVGRRRSATWEGCTWWRCRRWWRMTMGRSGRFCTSATVAAMCKAAATSGCSSTCACRGAVARRCTWRWRSACRRRVPSSSLRRCFFFNAS